jgi:hypothetical protein
MTNSQKQDRNQKQLEAQLKATQELQNRLAFAANKNYEIIQRLTQRIGELENRIKSTQK